MHEWLNAMILCGETLSITKTPSTRTAERRMESDGEWCVRIGDEYEHTINIPWNGDPADALREVLLRLARSRMKGSKHA